jgi:hypothetical protein
MYISRNRVLYKHREILPPFSACLLWALCKWTQQYRYCLYAFGSIWNPTPDCLRTPRLYWNCNNGSRLWTSPLDRMAAVDDWRHWELGFRSLGMWRINECFREIRGITAPMSSREKLSVQEWLLHPWRQRHHNLSKRRKPLALRHSVTSQHTWIPAAQLTEPKISKG